MKQEVHLLIGFSRAPVACDVIGRVQWERCTSRVTKRAFSLHGNELIRWSEMVQVTIVALMSRFDNWLNSCILFNHGFGAAAIILVIKCVVTTLIGRFLELCYS